MGKVYPKGSSFGQYFITVDPSFIKQPLTIRRHIVLPSGETIQPRYPRKLYKDLTTKEEIEQLVTRLNYRQELEAKRKIQIRTSFIAPSLMETFEHALLADIPNQKDARYLYQTVFKRYFLDFFIGRLRVLDPQQWSKHQGEWGAALLGKSTNPEHKIFETKVSVKTIKAAIQIANRFMAFLHTQMPQEYPALKFSPISKGALKTYAAELYKEPIGLYISPQDWAKISEKLPADWGCFINLMYHYGLRRSESLGFDNTDSVRHGALTVSHQLKSYDPENVFYSVLKDKEHRDTPHWFATPNEAYKWITEGLTHKMHPDTLSQCWEDFMEDMNMEYKLHDFRRTFITRALRERAPRDVQMAVGHANLTTTMKYAQDDREIQRAIWKPS